MISSRSATRHFKEDNNWTEWTSPKLDRDEEDRINGLGQMRESQGLLITTL